MKRFIYLLLFVLVSTAFLKSYAKDLKEITPSISYSFYKNKLKIVPVSFLPVHFGLGEQQTG